MVLLKHFFLSLFVVSILSLVACSPKTCGDSSICQCTNKRNHSKEKRSALKTAKDAQAFNEDRKVKSSWYNEGKVKKAGKKKKRKKREKF